MKTRTTITLPRKNGIGMIAAVFWLVVASVSLAQEITPVVGDLRIHRGAVTLDLRLNAEAYVLGVEPGAMSGSETAEYLDLRALEPEMLRRRLSEAGQSWVPDVRIEVDGTDVLLALTAVRVGAVGDQTLPRISRITLTGSVPREAEVFRVSWPDGAGTLVLRQQRAALPFSGYVDGGQSGPLVYVRGGGEVRDTGTFKAYVQNGFFSILPGGMDHVLFVLALFFLSPGLRALLWQVAAFTFAHSVTLALATLGLISVPAGLVAPLIAVSIVYVAAGNILSRDLSRLRLMAVFIFGLVHGVGLSGALAAYEPLAVQTIPALLGFNAGVEIGQLAVLAIAFFGIGYWFGARPWYRSYVAVPVSGFIAIAGVVWFAALVVY